MAVAKCHPDRKLLAKGLCSPCYQREWRLRDLDVNLAKARERARRRYAKNSEKITAYNRARYQADIERRRDIGREQSKEWRRKNSDEYRERHRAWYYANHERVKANKRSHRARNVEKARKSAREWVRAHPERWVGDQAKRRARLRDGASCGVTVKEWGSILEAFDHRCAYCLASGVKLTRDHVEPLARGGRDEPSNVVPACGSCNSRKGNRTLLRFLVLSQEDAKGKAA